MASKTESAVVNAAGLVLVTFPAASTIFTERSEYGLSSSQYGNMFLPQVATAITASLLGTALAPVLVAIFVGLGFWWGLPILSAVLLVALLLFSAAAVAAGGLAVLSFVVAPMRSRPALRSRH